MSWLFSRALVVEYLEGTCSDGEPFAPSNGNPTPQAYLSPDKMTAFSRLSRFGMTFAPLMDARGEELLTWFRAASRARTSAQPVEAPESTASAAGFGEKWRELSAKYDLATFSWRTHRCLWDEDLPESSVTLPKWGSMRNGVLWERKMLALPTKGNESGCWVGTPTATMSVRSEEFAKGRLPQPAELVKQWPTPQARDHRTGQLERYENPDRTKNLNDQIGGQLNPTWVEWLMGWPLGWTDLKPSATGKSRNAQRRHGGC